MAADVAVPAKPIMDIFKGSSDSELQNSPRSRSRNSRKAKGILDFFNSSCRSSVPNAQKTNVCDSAVDQVMDTTDCQIVKGTFHEVAQSDKHLSHNGSEDIKRKSLKKGKNTETTLTKETSKPRKQTKTNKRTVVDLKPDLEFTETEPEIVEENERSFGKQENNSSRPQEIDYEDFKRTLLHNGEENTSVPQIELESNLTSPKQCSKHFNIADEEEPASKIQVIEKEQLDTQESGSSESDRRQSRPRMRKIYHQTDMCGFAVCPALTPSPKSATDKDKSESDISLQGKDILEMTYEEYLKSIGASFEDVDESTNKEKVIDKTQVNLVAENVQGTKGSSTILNYFSKAQRKSEESSIVIIHADVHSQPNVSKESQKNTRKPVCKREQSIHTKQPSSLSSDMEIIFLGTETLEQSVEEEKSKMAETNNSDTLDKNTENYKQSPVKKKLNFLTEKSTSVGTSWNKAQSTLQFKQDGGLEMVKSVKPLQHSTPLVDADTTKSQTKVDICKNISVRKGKCEEASDLCNNSVCLLDDDKQDVHADQVRTKALNKFAKHEKEMDDTSDSKDFTPRSRRASTIAQARAQELQKAQQQVQPANNKSSKEETLERSSEISSHGESNGKDCNKRRQSSRLIHQHQVEGQKLYIEVETSDSEEEVDHSLTYKSAGADCSLLTRSKEKAVQESSKKLGTGKLAPIFSKKRSTNQPETMASQSSENPEAVRKRREFLMSGVPSELKCQIQPIEPLLVGAEYAPLPSISHVQQKELVEDGNLDFWSLPYPKHRLNLRSENYIEDVCKENVKWNLLGWTTLSQKEDNLPNLPALDEITTEQNHALLQVLSKSDPSFPFAGVYENLKVRLNKTSGKRGILKDTIGGTIAKSSKRHLSDDIDVMIVDDIEEPATLQTCQWTEALQPTLVSELVGNVDSLRRLQTWLEEWKKHIQSEVRRSSDSESDPNDIDSEEDSSQLCNTMLLVGPHGVGKTSAVYALAQQLSYKVFEVSASSSRQGRHILAQLQEATQSHQVAQKKDGIIHKHSVPNEKSPTKRCVKKPEHGMCKAFEHFFKKSTKDSPKKEGTKKRKLESSLEAGQSPKKLRDGRVNKEETKRVTSAVDDGSYAGCINLMSTSLILFDEVDIVFEEDSGFLQTVQHFISTTKIPIIMTTADPGFGRELNARFEQLIFAVPPLHSINSYLQIISLAAGVRTSPEDLQSLATMCGGDLRHLILTLQFFILSGGSRVQESLPLDSVSMSEKGSGDQNTKTELSRLDPSPFSIAAKCSNDSVDFISLKLRRKRSRRIQDDEESDNKVINDCEPGKSNLLKAGMSKSGAVALDGQTVPMVHSHLCESMLGVSQDLKSLLLQCLEDSTLSPSINKLVSECLKLRIHKIDVVYSNLMQLLPLPKTVMPNRSHPPLTSDCVRGRNRIRIADVSDSEASDDENVLKIAKVARTNITVNTDRHGTHGKQITSDRKNAPSDDKSEAKEEQSKSGEHFSGKILSNFAHYYDSVSLVDMLKCTNNNFPNPMTDRHFRLLSGLADVAALEPDDDDSCSLSQEISVEVGVQAARHLWQSVKCYIDTWKQLSGRETIDGCSLPLHSNRSTKLVLEKEFEEISVPKTYRDVVESVTSNLPLTCYHSHRPVSLDYLPTLRSISNAEQLRQVAKAKRRFHHYFDNIGLCLNATTLKALGSSFPTVQETGIEN